MSVGATVAGLTLISQFGETRAAELFIGECDDGRCLVKLVRAELCGDRARVERALDATRTVGALDHRGIEFVIEAGWDGDRAYVLGDIVPGTNATRLVARRSLDEEQVLAIVRLVAEALAAAHVAGVVHGALELQLIHVGFASDRVVLRDFGIAELGEGATRGDGSPEGDVYALGCIAREMRDTISKVPAELDDLIARMCATDPTARPTAVAIRDELEARDRGAENVAVAQTETIEKRRAPTEPPDGATRSPETDTKPEAATARPPRPPMPPSRLARAAWRCDRCDTPNTRGRAFCVHCGAPASANAVHDVQSLMASLAAHGSDEVTPPPGPPPSPDDDEN